jgi:hypothetical protein
MRARTWWSAVSLPLLATAALLVTTGPASGAGPGDLLPSVGPTLPSVPPLPSPTVPALPTPTATHTTPHQPTLPPTGTAAAGPGTRPGPVAPPDVAGATTPDGGAALIASDPGADLYPQPPVQPPTTPAGQFAVQLGDVEHRIQYLHNVLTRTADDLAVAQGQLGPVPELITVLTGPVTAPSEGRPVDTPAGRVAALSAALASGRAELARREAQAQALQQQITGQLAVATTGAPAATLRWPLSGRLTSRYGNRLDPYYHVWQLHPGIDIADPPGTPIHAAAAGRVTRAGWYGGYGNYTCIDHGQFDGQPVSTCYGHQTRILVAPGQQVTAGQLIGLVGSTGASTGPHLHFEVRLSGHPVDPLPWLG